jgi:Uma2 family endonuclease
VPALLPIDAAIPRSAVLDPSLTDAEPEALAIASEWFRLERTREGKILMRPPTGLLTGDGNSEITSQLRAWWKTHRLGRVVDSNGTYFLADSSMLSPDASYVVPNKLKGLTKDELRGFPRLCPDFVVELLSASDSLPKAQEKMERWIENGVTLGWLIDPCTKKVHVYVPGSEAAVESGNSVRGQGPVEGFILDLDELWRCYEI